MKSLAFFLVLLVMAGCNSNDEKASPFAEILSRQPYSPFTDSLRQDPTRDDLYFQRAVLLNKNNLPEPALADFLQAWALRKEEGYAVGASNILLEKKPDSAIVFLKEAMQAVPQSLFLQLSLVRAYDAQHQTKEAIEVCDSILATEPDQVNTLMLKAELMEKASDTAGIISTLEKAYRLLPANKEIAEKLMYKYAETKNTKALRIADSLISKDSLRIYTSAYYVKGVYYINTGDQANAVKAFNLAIQHDHRYLNAYIEKGKVLLDQKKTSEALQTFELANRISPAFSDAWYWMGRCLELLGQKKEAKLNYEKAYSLDKTFTEAKEAADKIKD